MHEVPLQVTMWRTMQLGDLVVITKTKGPIRNESNVNVIAGMISTFGRTQDKLRCSILLNQAEHALISK